MAEIKFPMLTKIEKHGGLTLCGEGGCVNYNPYSPGSIENARRTLDEQGRHFQEMWAALKPPVGHLVLCGPKGCQSYIPGNAESYQEALKSSGIISK